MRYYEIVVMVHPDQSEQVPALVDKYRAVIKAHKGKVSRHEDWGRRSLAYQIRRLHKAHYLLFNVQASAEAIAELRAALEHNDAVIRHLIFSVDDAPEEASAMMEKIRRERKRESERARPTATEGSEESKDFVEGGAMPAAEIAADAAPQPSAEQEPQPAPAS